MLKFKELVNIANTKTQIIMKVTDNGLSYPTIEYKSVLSMDGKDSYMEEDIYDTAQGYAFWFSGYNKTFKEYEKKTYNRNDKL